MSAPVTVPEVGDVRSRRWLDALPLRLATTGEERLARLAGEGNERAFAVLYERYHQALYRYCRSLVRMEVDAQDALQSTFTAALVALQHGQRDAPLRPWLFRIAHNESISLLRRRRPEEELSEAIESTTPSAERSAEDRARLASLVADLADLPERQRGALLMRELSGLSHEEIADVLGVSLGAAKQTIFEARRSLAEFAEGRTMACDEVQRVISDGDGRALRARRVRAHLRDCARCAAFAAAIPAREADLLALAPALPIAAASGILAHVTSAGSGSSGGAGATGVAASATGKAATTVLSLKAVSAGVVMVTAAAAGTAGVLHALPGSHARTARSHTPTITHRPASRTTSGSAAPSAAAAHSGPGAGQATGVGAAVTTASGTAGGSADAARTATNANAPAAPGKSGSAPGHGNASRAGAGAGHHGTAAHQSAGKHLGATNHTGAGSRPGATKQRGAASGHRGSGSHHATTSHHGSGSHSPQLTKSKASGSGKSTSSTGSSSSTAGAGSALTPSGQSSAQAGNPSGSQSSQGAGRSTTTTPAPASDSPASATDPQASGTGQGHKSN
jgi:RNA polymerase sigma factor (sigma-70 family)